jgi:hypothetical protein
MVGPDRRWEHSSVYVWITAQRVDVFGSGQLTQGICGVVDDPAFVRENENAFVWNAYPVPTGPQPPSTERPR